MPDRVLPGPIQENAPIREAVSIHTNKIFDSCKDKDCIEDLRFYPTCESQRYIDSAVSVRAKSAQLLFVNIDVEEVTFNRGFYTVDIRYFYKIRGDAFSLVNKPSEITGLAIFDKRVILFGSEGNAKIFTSKTALGGIDGQVPGTANLPTAIVEAVDPIVLGMKLVDVCENQYECGVCVAEVPEFIAEGFGSDLLFDSTNRRVYVTLGQFSIIRLERDTQLLMPSYDYFMPDKECLGGSEDDACTLFSKIRFPVDEFVPPDPLDPPEGYREARANLGK
jgi:hypothetical protein